MPDIGFVVSGWEPTQDIAWTLAGKEGQRTASREAARLILTAMNLQLAAGVDKRGRLLRPIHAKTARSRARNVNPVSGEKPYSPMGRADPANAPLQSTGVRSRTRSLLRARFRPDGIYVTWAVDPFTKAPWGVVLARHAAGYWQRFADGGYGYVPPRDVIGLAPQYLMWFRGQFEAWWRANRKKLALKGMRLDDGNQDVVLMVPSLRVPVPVVKPTPGTVKATKKPRRPDDGTAWVERTPATTESMIGLPRPLGSPTRRYGQKVYRGAR